MKYLLAVLLLLVASAAQAQTCTRQSATSQNCIFNLSWTASVPDSSHDPATSYIVERKIGSGSFASIGTVSVTTFQDTINNDPGNTSVSYQVRSANSAGPDGTTNVVTKTTPAITPLIPNPPTNLQVSALSSSQIFLSWQAQGSDQTFFQAEVKQVSGLKPEFPGNATNGTIGGLKRNTNYDVRLAAGNATGLSAPTNYVKVKTLK